jgi:hypothetical protein
MGSNTRPARKADNLTPSDVQLPIKCGILDVSQPHGAPKPVTGIFFIYKPETLISAG